ncbi:MAG: tRNA pseudouridine(55) synthase TruB [Clostridia bacterium]|nr:tRNA pseudouridine(55) synthase TruB [Clostridia bacterium]
MKAPASVSGILIVNKHAGVTSADIVNRLRRLYGTRQVGHTGTLDPMATGVLPVLIGRAVKAADFIVSENKRYTAEMRLGITTDTEDTTGTVLTTSEELPGQAEVLDAAARFVGDILQIPPMYSALKVNGKKLVDLAREGITIEREARPIRIESLAAVRLSDNLYRLDVRCSKGTYIRTLCADIGASLGCGAAMASLIRTESGPFSLEDAITVAQLEEMTSEERAACIIPLDRFFADCPSVHLSDFYARLAHNGCEVYQKKIGTTLPDGALVRLYRSISEGDEFFALGRVMKYADGSAVKPVKLFVL